MNTHPEWAGRLNWLLNHSLQAGVLVVLVLAVQWIFRGRLTNRWRFALWWIVLVRLLLPFSPQSAMSLFNLMRPAVQIESPRPGTPMDNVPVSAPVISMPATDAQPPPMEHSSKVVSAAPASPPPAQSISVVAPVAKAVLLPKHPVNWRALLVPVVVGLWLAGVLILSGVVLWQVSRFYRKLSKATAPADANLQPMLDECRHEFGVSQRVEIMETDAVQSPALFGLLRLRLLVPRGFGGQFSGRELRYIFLHELAHVKRGDLWLNWLVTALQILHWFNPLLWLGFARLRADRELACDELALLRAGDSAGTAYGETVMKLLENLSRPAAIPGLVGILEDKQQMRRRISMIANFRRPGKWSALAVLLIIGVGAAALTDAQTEKSETKQGLPASSITNEMTNFTQMTVTVLDAETGRPVPGAKVTAPYIDFWHQPGDRLIKDRPLRRTDTNGEAVVNLLGPPDGGGMMQNFNIIVSAKNYPLRSVMWVADGGRVLDTLPPSYIFHLQKGITVGGFVQDEHGQPVAGATVVPWGSGYRGFSMGTGVKLHQEYSEMERYGSKGNTDAKGHITDEKGFWQADNFPADLTTVRVDVVRPGGARSQFTTEPDDAQRLSVEQADKISLGDLLATNLVLSLKEGYTVHAVVKDQAGNPIAGVRLKARGGQLEQTPAYIFTNGPDGKVEFDHWTALQFVVTAEADGFATKSMVLSAADNAGEKEIILSPAHPLRVRVLGQNDEPVGGATFSVINWRTANQLVDWNGVTDVNGLAVWTNAPDQPVSFWITAGNYPVLAAKLSADGPEQVVHLRKGSDQSISVHLTVSDSATGKPLPEFEVSRSQQYEQAFKAWGLPGISGEFQEKLAVSEFQPGIVPSFKLKIDADGYQSWIGDDLYFDEGDQNIAVKLVKGVVPAGVVRQPDGRPAADAKVVLCAADYSTVFFNAPFRSYPGRGCITERSAADGTFQLPSAKDGQYIVASHDSGFTVMTVGELRSAKEIHLQAWAEVEGVLRADGKPVPNMEVSVQAPMNWSALEGFNLIYSDRTDVNGHFLFTNLPPSDYVLFQQPHIIMGSTTVESHRWPFELKAGEHKQIDYTFGGRQVAGHVETETPVDWQNDGQILVLKTKVVESPAPNYWAYVNKDDYNKARIAYAHSPEVAAAERAQQQFQLVFDKDGNFHADDVPPGDYELRLHVTRPPKDDKERWSGQREELGSLTRDVSVTAGNGAVDLGTIAMSVKPATDIAMDTTAETPRPARLTATGLDGKTVSLSQLKGQTVLLVFWAAWSDRCTEQLAEIGKLQTELGAAGKFTVLGVNLDDDAASVRDAIKARGYSWPQARLDGESRANASADFDVSSLPSFDLIDPTGRVVAHDLDGKLVRGTVERALKNK